MIKTFHDVKGARAPHVNLVWGYTILLVLIGIVVVTRRTLFLVPVLNGTYAPVKPDAFPPDGFVNNPLLTLLHISPALLYALLGVLQFAKPIRNRWPRFHRWNGRVALTGGLVVGVSGIIMGFKMAISGVAETAAITLFGTFFVFSLIKAFVHVRRRQYDHHREWMIRAFATGMAVTATRPIVGIFFATSPVTGLGPRDFFGTALWIGFTLQLMAAEVWINRTRAV